MSSESKVKIYDRNEDGAAAVINDNNSSLEGMKFHQTSSSNRPCHKKSAGRNIIFTFQHLTHTLADLDMQNDVSSRGRSRNLIWERQTFPFNEGFGGLCCICHRLGDLAIHASPHRVFYNMCVCVC